MRTRCSFYYICTYACIDTYVDKMGKLFSSSIIISCFHAYTHHWRSPLSLIFCPHYTQQSTGALTVGWDGGLTRRWGRDCLLVILMRSWLIGLISFTKCSSNSCQTDYVSVFHILSGSSWSGEVILLMRSQRNTRERQGTLAFITSFLFTCNGRCICDCRREQSMLWIYDEHAALVWSASKK